MVLLVYPVTIITHCHDLLIYKNLYCTHLTINILSSSDLDAFWCMGVMIEIKIAPHLNTCYIYDGRID